MELNQKLKGFVQHGVRFTGKENEQTVGVCPFCYKNKHFMVEDETSALLWHCHSCGEGGNFFQFLEKRALIYQDDLKGKALNNLCKDRKLSSAVFKAFNVGWTGEFYSIPCTGNALNGNVTINIIRYIPGGKAVATSSSKLSFIVPFRMYNSETV